jgi:hypothetical protein
MSKIEEYNTIATPVEAFEVRDGDVDSSERKRSRGKILFAGGVLGVVGVAFVLAAPELGVLSAVGGTLASIGSAGITILSRR